jgi:Domain of unknown function (DUF397)
VHDHDFVVSSYCHTGGCVAVRIGPDGVDVRDSKVSDGPILTFTTEVWVNFVAGLKGGEFDIAQRP